MFSCAPDTNWSSWDQFRIIFFLHKFVSCAQQEHLCFKMFVLLSSCHLRGVGFSRCAWGLQFSVIPKRNVDAFLITVSYFLLLFSFFFLPFLFLVSSRGNRAALLRMKPRPRISTGFSTNKRCEIGVRVGGRLASHRPLGPVLNPGSHDQLKVCGASLENQVLPLVDAWAASSENSGRLVLTAFGYELQTAGEGCF